MTQVQLAEAANTTQRAVSYYETETGFPPAPAVIDLAKALKVSTDELLGVRPPRVERVKDDPEERRMWKRFQMVTALPERDQKAVIRLINSLVGVGASRRNGEQGDAMPADSHAKQHLHQLVDQLGPAQMAAVLQLLEVMVEPEDEPLGEDDIRAIEASREHFRHNPGGGVSFEEFVAECGFTMDQVLGHKD